MDIYQVVTGPAAWLAFGIFGIGVIVRAVLYIRGLDWQLDRVAYTAYPYHGFKGAIRSIGFWLIPFGTRGWRYYPFFTLVFFTFHIGLILTPIFLKGHAILVQERFGIDLITLSGTLADALTIGVMVAALLLVLRRIALPEVRIITTAYDYLILAIAAAPFVTGFLAAHQIGSYSFWLIAHIISGEIMLIAIPFTKLSHFILFFMSRMQIGMDFGIKRGGMKSKGMAW